MRFHRLKGTVQQPSVPRARSIQNWALEVNRAIRQIVGMGVDIAPSDNANGQPHPWRLSVVRESSTNRLYVQYGMVTMPNVQQDSANDYIPYHDTVEPTMSDGSSTLAGNPQGTTPGYETLANNTADDYGVWIEIDADVAGTTVTLGSPTGNHGLALTDGNGPWFDLLRYNHSNLTATITVNNTYVTQFAAASIIAANTGKTYFWVGSVNMTAGNVPTIVQHRKSDLDVPVWTWPAAFDPSSDANNDITEGTDGRVFYDAP